MRPARGRLFVLGEQALAQPIALNPAATLSRSPKTHTKPISQQECYLTDPYTGQGTTWRMTTPGAFFTLSLDGVTCFSHVAVSFVSSKLEVSGLLLPQ